MAEGARGLGLKGVFLLVETSDPVVRLGPANLNRMKLQIEVKTFKENLHWGRGEE